MCVSKGRKEVFIKTSELKLWTLYHDYAVKLKQFNRTKLTNAVRYKRLKHNKTFEDYLCYISQVNKYFR